MAQETDPWGAVGVPDWSAEAKVTIRGADPEGRPLEPREIPLSWAADMLTRWRERNAPQWGRDLGLTLRVFYEAPDGTTIE